MLTFAYEVHPSGHKSLNGSWLCDWSWPIVSGAHLYKQALKDKNRRRLCWARHMIKDLKSAERKRAEQRRGAAFDADAVAAANAALQSLIARYPGDITGYLAIRTEMDPMPTMRVLSADRDVGVPIIKAKATPLVFAKWKPDCTLIEGTFKVMTPDPAVMMTPKILIVPLLAFDREGYRLGYGGGFYDRTIEQLGPDVTTIGFAYAAQECDDVPREATDQRLDYIVTERETLSFR